MQTFFSVDMSASAIEVSLQQSINCRTQPLTFFSYLLKAVEFRCNLFTKEPLVINLAGKHFSHVFEGRDFTIFLDHKLLPFALLPKRTATRSKVHVTWITYHRSLVTIATTPALTTSIPTLYLYLAYLLVHCRLLLRMISLLLSLTNSL